VQVGHEIVDGRRIVYRTGPRPRARQRDMQPPQQPWPLGRTDIVRVFDVQQVRQLLSLVFEFSVSHSSLLPGMGVTLARRVIRLRIRREAGLSRPMDGDCPTCAARSDRSPPVRTGVQRLTSELRLPPWGPPQNGSTSGELLTSRQT
jgi:hypothetical protein